MELETVLVAPHLKYVLIESDGKFFSIKHSDALDKFDEVKLFAHAKDNAFLLDKIQECISLVQDDLIAMPVNNGTWK